MKRLTRFAEKSHAPGVYGRGRLRRDKQADLRLARRMLLSDYEQGTGLRRLRAAPSGEPVLSDFNPDTFAILTYEMIENALRHGDDTMPLQISPAADRALHAGPMTARGPCLQYWRGAPHELNAAEGNLVAPGWASPSQRPIPPVRHLRSPIAEREDQFEALFHQHDGTRDSRQKMDA